MNFERDHMFSLLYRLVTTVLPAFTGVLFLPFLAPVEVTTPQALALGLGAGFAFVAGTVLSGPRLRLSKLFMVPLLAGAAAYFLFAVSALRPASAPMVFDLTFDLGAMLIGVLQFFAGGWYRTRKNLAVAPYFLAAFLTAATSIEIYGSALDIPQIVLAFAVALFSTAPTVLRISRTPHAERLFTLFVFSGPFLLSGLSLFGFLPMMYHLVTISTLACTPLISKLQRAPLSPLLEQTAVKIPPLLWVATVIARAVS